MKNQSPNQFLRYLTTCGYPEKTVESRKNRLSVPFKLGLLSGEPERLLVYLNEKSTATKLATYSDVISFFDYLISKGIYRQKINPYRQFKQSHKRLFRIVKTYKHTEFTLTEAEQAISLLTNERYRLKALELLYTGLRWHDSFNIFEDGEKCVQKGGQIRQVFMLKPVSLGVSGVTRRNQAAFRNALRSVGLGIHELRKVFATHAATELNLSPYELSQALGHSSINTAMHYVGINSEVLRKKLMSA